MKLLQQQPSQDLYDCVIIGAGAAGSVAAIQLARKGISTCIIDRQTEIARAILATGAGACNLTNTKLDPTCYNDPSFVKGIFGAHPEADILSFFQELGLMTTEKDGRVYPLSLQALSVQQVIQHELTRWKASSLLAREVVDVSPHPNGFCISYRFAYADDIPQTLTSSSDAGASAKEDAKKTHTICARTVIVATGGKHSLDFLPADLARTKPAPALCPLACEQDPLFALSGRRAHVTLMLTRNHTRIFSERGELLIRDFGLSGIVVFNASRYARAGDHLFIDFCPTQSYEALSHHLKHFVDARINARVTHELKPTPHADPASLRAQALKKLLIDALCGIIDPLLAELIYDQAHARAQARERVQMCADKTTPSAYESEIHALVECLKSYCLVVAGPAQTEHAQTWQGGILRSSLHTATLQSKTYPNLWAIGEAVDIDAACGGYNLSWAWMSAFTAAQDVARSLTAPSKEDA